MKIQKENDLSVWAYFKKAGPAMIIFTAGICLIDESKYIQYFIMNQPIIAGILVIVSFAILLYIAYKKDKAEAKFREQKEMTEKASNTLLVEHIKNEIPDNVFKTLNGSTDKEKVINYIKSLDE